MSYYFESLKNNPLIISVEELLLTKEIIDRLASYQKGEQYILEAVENIKKLSFFKIIYSVQNHKVIGFLIQPHNMNVSPCVIYNRGGSGNFSKIELERIFTDKYAKYSNWGYVTLMSQYSGNDGGEGKDELGGNEINDVLALRDVLSNYSFADTDRIVMYGSSRGGTMTYLALSKVSWVRAAVVKSGMADRFRSFNLRPQMKERAKHFFDVDSEKELVRRSAVYWADDFCKNTPVLLLHGEKDDSVSPLDSLDMSKMFLERDIPFSLVIFEGGDHSLSQYTKEEDVLVREWFTKHLK